MQGEVAVELLGTCKSFRRSCSCSLRLNDGLVKLGWTLLSYYCGASCFELDHSELCFPPQVGHLSRKLPDWEADVLLFRGSACCAVVVKSIVTAAMLTQIQSGG